MWLITRKRLKRIVCGDGVVKNMDRTYSSYV